MFSIQFARTGQFFRIGFSGIFLLLTLFLLLPILKDTVDSSKYSPGPAFDGQKSLSYSGYGRIPLHFEKNRGQADDPIQFLAHGAGYTLGLTCTEAILNLTNSHPGELNRTISNLKMSLPHSNPRPELRGLKKKTGQSHYFIGNDPEKWRTHIPHFSRVEYQEIYPGIDLVYYGNQQTLEFDFVVAPDTDPSVIRLDFEGHDDRFIDSDGNLILTIRENAIVLKKPEVYQDIDDNRHFIDGEYLLTGGVVGFELGSYDSDRTLIIDPELVYSTFLGGGGGTESGFGIAVDDNGNAYVTGTTASTTFPVSDDAYQKSRSPHSDPWGYGWHDAFVAKLNADYPIFVSKLNSEGTGLQNRSEPGCHIIRDLWHWQFCSRKSCSQTVEALRIGTELSESVQPGHHNPVWINKRWTPGET